MALSAQDFIRALKASSDPPHPGGPTKLELAVRTWQDPALLVPNKEENIVDWLLTRLLKEKDAPSLSSPLLDLQVWKLLCDILEVSARSTNASRSSRPLRSWLLPLLNRLPIAPIVVALLGAAHHEQPAEVLHVAGKTLSTIWPMAVPKISIDALLDCFSAVTRLLAQPYWKQMDDAAAEAILRLSNLVISSYRSAINGSAAKKKVFAHFIQNTFQDWVQCTSVGIDDHNIEHTLSEVYQAGIDTVFSLDILRQAQGLPDEAIEDSLRRAADSHSNAVLAALPRIFHSYINISQKHRNTLFAQGSSRGTITSAEQARKAGMKVFASFIQVIRSLPTTGDSWKTTAALLDTVDSQRLLTVGDEAAQETLKAVGELACAVLTSHTQESHSTEAASALSACATIVHIDYDLAAPILPRILRAIVTNSFPTDSSNVLLDHVLEYNTQTRSADVLIDLLLSVCGSQTFTESSSIFENLYVTASTSILNSHIFIDKLSTFIHAFTTPGQILKIAQSTIEHLRTVSSEFYEVGGLPDADDISSPRKKRKMEKGAQTASVDTKPIAISLSMTAGIASTVLTSLPLHLLQNDDRKTVIDTIQDFFGSTQAMLKSAAKRIAKEGASRSWTWQVVGSSLLRLRYDLSSDRHLQLDTEGSIKVAEKLSPMLKLEDLSPQLRIEILRSWLLNVEKHQSEPSPVFDEFLAYIEKWLPGHDVSWNGELCHLSAEDDGQNQAAVAILYNILNRWLSLFDAQATEEQCQRLVTVITTALSQQASHPPSSDVPGVFVRDVLNRVLHNAVFWESHRLRDALLAHISAKTAPLDELDVKTLLSPSGSKERAGVASNLSPLVAGTFDLLLSTPMEYLTKRARSELLRRAQAADIAIVGVAEDSILTMLREFQRRMYEFLGSVDHPFIAEYSLVLVNSFNDREAASEILVSTTQGLVGLHFSAAVKLSAQNESILLQILNSFTTTQSFNLLSRSHNNHFRANSVVQLIDIITVECKPTSITTTIRNHLVALQGQLLPELLSAMSSVVSKKDSTEDRGLLPVLNLWHRFLVLSRWLSCQDEYPRFGQTLVRYLLSAKHGDTEVFVAALSIIQEEVLLQAFHTSETDCSEIVATYLAFTKRCSKSDLSALDSSLGNYCRSSSLSHFGTMLDLLYEGLSVPGLSHDYLVRLVHASDVVMRHAPEGSLKVLQTHLSRSLVVFADLIASEEGGDILGDVLAFLGSQFNDRPAMIRQQDLSSVWSILGSCFKGSIRHEPATSKTVLNDAVSVISALLRLRRDLVTTTLPHLSFIFRRLIMTLRRLRPHLGGKQTRLVSDTLPSWINASDPARVEDSKAIARLLTTLTTKTIVRTYGTAASADGQKAESLARPFSKHAAYVLCAYIEALNDPLCMIPAEVRKELEPGLFALCDMMGENNRDAMMVASLDAGGKSVMKGIWREYEKQKYVGKG